MADVQSNIKVSIDTTEALAQLKALQRQISAFHTSMAKTGAAGAAVSANMSQNLVNTINSSGKFYAEMTKIRTTSEAFNTALAKNQLSMKEYFRYSGAATKTFGRLFAQEHATINKVARENVKTLQTQYIKMGRDASGALRGIAVRPLALDMNNLQTQTAMAAQKQALLNQLLRQGSTNLLNFGKNTQWAGRQLMVGFTVPLMYFGAVASKTFMQLEEQAIRFKRVYGDMFTSSSDTAKALKDVQLLANTFTQYGVAVADTMKMAADVAATGKVGADLLAQVSNATRLAVLGGIDQQKSLDTIISLTSTFGIESKNLADNINFLNAVENQTILNIDDLTTAIPKAAPVIKQLGGDVKDLAFFMTAMREGGINAAEGANALKSGLANMINPTKAARQMLAGFGIDIVGIVNADKGNVKKMVVDLATALDALDPLNRAQAIEKMFGKFQFSRISTLFQNVIRDGSQAKTVLGLTNSTAQELAILSERELNKISDSPMYKFKKEIQDLKTSLAPIGGEFLKALTPIVKFFGDIFKSFNGLGDGTKKFIVILTTVLAGIGPLVLMSFGLLANAVANIIKLFVGIKSIFNGAGKASVGLGEQTNFLTQEQMQNAAAAASLDQAHQKLQQRFTSEAAAVRLLTQAYEQSVIAQRAFSASGVIGRTPGMKLATGIVSVPGPKGAGDIVPAMLSPGEAVVPAKNVAKYPAFTSALVTGNIAGHMAGTAPAFAHAAMPFAPGSAQYIQGIKIAGLEQLAQQFPQFIRVVSNLVAELPQKLNVAMQKGTAKAADFQKAWDARSGKFSTAAKLGGMDMSNPKLTAALARLEVEVGKRTLSLAQASAIEKDAALGLQKGTSKVVVSDELFAKATNQVIEEFQLLDQSSRAASTALRAASQQVGQVRASLPTAVLRDGLASGTFTATRGPNQRQSNIMYGDTNVGRQSGSNPNKFYPANSFTPSGSYAREVKLAVETKVKEMLAGIKQGATEILKTQSPSKELRIVGEQAGEGLIVGSKSKVNAAHTAGETLGVAAAEGVASQAGRVRRVAASTQGAPGSMMMYNPAAAAPAGTPLLPIVKGGTPPAGNTEPEMTKKEITKARLQKAQGPMMAASMVAMMGSMVPGKIGDISQKLMMPLMALSMMMPYMSNVFVQLGLVAAVIIASVVALKMAFNKARDAALESANVIGTSTAAIRKISVFANTVSAGETMDRIRLDSSKIYAGQQGKTTFGQSYMDSEEGKATYKALAGQYADAAKPGMTGARPKSEINNMIGDQLVNAVMSGAVTSEQAQSMAVNLARELGDIGLGVNLRAKIIEMVGPNGENLEKDPYNVRLKMVQDASTQQQASTQRLLRSNRGVSQLGRSAAQQTGIVAGAAGIGAAIGTAILPGIGSVVGALIGGVAGYLSQRARNKQFAALAGAAAADQANSLAQNKEALDSLDLYYMKKVEQLKLEGKIAEAKELQAKWDGHHNDLVKEELKNRTNIVETYNNAGSAQGALLSGAKKAVTSKYTGTNQEAFVDAAQGALGSARSSGGLDSGQEYLLTLAMSSGELNPQQVLNLVDPTKPKQTKLAMDIYTKFGGVTASQMADVTTMFVDQEGNFNESVKTEFMAQVGLKPDDVSAQKFISLMGDVAAGGGVYDADFMVNAYLADTDAAKELQRIMDEVELNKNGLTIDVLYNIDSNFKGNVDEDYFKNLNKDEKLVYTKTVASLVNIPPAVIMADKDYTTWLGESYKGPDGKIHGGQQWASASPAKKLAQYIMDQGYDATKDGVVDTTLPTDSSTTTDKKGPTSSPLDEFIKKLRDLRQLQIQLTVGWKASLAAMDKYFKIGANGGAYMNKSLLSKKGEFMGLSPQLRKQGANQQTIDFITGLSPEDFKKYNNKLFKIQKDGSIRLLAEGKKLNLMMQAIAVGNFADAQDQVIQKVNDQSKGFTKLMALGYTTKQAYDALTDAEFANALASGKMKEADIKAAMAKQVLKDKIQEQYEAQKHLNDLLAAAEEKYARTQGFLGIVDQLKGMGVAVEDMVAILGDPQLADALIKDLKDGKLEAKNIADYIQKLKDQKIIDISVQIKTGQYESAFQPGYDAAQKIFDIQSKLIDMQWREKLAADQKEIDNAQEKVDLAEQEVEKAQDAVDAANALIDIQNKRNDKLSHDLKLMDHTTQQINDKYDEQKKALEEISNLNSMITENEKKQLTLADAISQGDISAAAKAAQDIRGGDAANSMTLQGKALDNARQLEIDQLRSAEGMTRLQIEQEQWLISEEIYRIQTNELANAQKLLDDKNKLLDAAQKTLKAAEDTLAADQKAVEEAKKRLTVAGLTKEQWDDLATKVAAAEVATGKYDAALAGALATADDVLSRWDDILDAFNKYSDKTVTITTIIKTIQEQAGSGSVDSYVPPAETPESLAAAKEFDDAVAELDAAQAALDAGTGGGWGADAAYDRLKERLAAAQAKYDAIVNAGLDPNYTGGGGGGKGMQVAAKGGMILPMKFALGGFAQGTDTVPAMLTPGEFIMSKYAVQSHGLDTMRAINKGDSASVGDSVYNYSLNVNVKSDANPDEIARTVIAQIKSIDSQRMRGSRL